MIKQIDKESLKNCVVINSKIFVWLLITQSRDLPKGIKFVYFLKAIIAQNENINLIAKIYISQNIIRVRKYKFIITKMIVKLWECNETIK
jgi:hypothetical protein